jgi:tetratricopeptide (TPR) repeat protein
MLDHLDTFEVVPDGELIFKFPKDQAAVLKLYALPLGEQAYKTYTEQYGFKPQGPILVEVFDKHDHFAVRTIGLMGITGALGACFGRVVTMDSPKARPPGDFSWQATEWHELAHVFTLQLSQYRVPRWLTEGLSVYEEHRRVPAWGRELTIEYARNLSKGRTFGVKGMAEAFKHGETLSLGYFEASLVAEHLIDLGGYPGIRTLLRAYGDGATDAEAFSKAYGKSLDDIDASFAAFVKQHYGALSAALADPPSEVDAKDLSALKARADKAPENFYSQWAYGRALFEAGNLRAARPALEKAAQLAPAARGSVSPHELLAQIAEKDGDLIRARKELRELLTYDHENVDAARHLAGLAAQGNAADDQDVGLRLVADLDPFDGDVHSRLGRRELAASHREAALIEFQAALALNPPNLAEAHTDVGEVLLALGRRDEARKEALQALQRAPSYARAQDLLLSANARH